MCFGNFYALRQHDAYQHHRSSTDQSDQELQKLIPRHNFHHERLHAEVTRVQLQGTCAEVNSDGSGR